MRWKKTAISLPSFALWSAAIPASAVYLIPGFNLAVGWLGLAYAGLALVFTYLANVWVGKPYKDSQADPELEAVIEELKAKKTK